MVEGSTIIKFELALQPIDSRYRLYMVTITQTGTSNNSDIIEFTTNLTDSFEYIQIRSTGIRLEEAVIVIIVVGIWACAVVLFVKQWDSIRILPPQSVRYKHAPKNLDTIRIVKKPQDSVIYKTFSRKMSMTMIAREKKLMRMNTVPIMENIHSLSSFKKLPTITMEEGVLEVQSESSSNA